ncbi:hypothetical protein MHU86_21819 [Fragilaria crotonensis]|nr:hypothetical protein MHU86_21819 [Fragilaria crotonensis]
MQAFHTDGEQRYYNSRRRHSNEKEKSRKSCPLALCTNHLALLVILAVTVPFGEAHRQRLPSQVTPATAPSFAPSVFPSLSISPNPSFYSIQQSDSSLPSEGPVRSPTSSLSASPSLSRSRLPSFLPSRDPTGSRTPTSYPSSPYPSFSPTISPSFTPTESPTDRFEFRTFPCSYDSSIEGYDELDKFLNDIDDTQVEKPYLICPNSTFEDAKIVIEARDVPLNIECGGEECVWLRTQLVITGPTAPVTFRGITFEESSETLLLVSGTDANVHFSECIWFGNSGIDIIRIDGEVPSGDFDETSDSHQSNITFMGNGTSDSQSGDVSAGNNTFDPQSDVTNSSGGTNDMSNNTIDRGNEPSVGDQNITGGKNRTNEVQQNSTYPVNSTGETQEAAATRYLTRKSVSVSFRMCSFVENLVSAAIVSSHYGELQFEECVFEMNQVTAGSLLHIDGGRVDLEGVRLDRNSYDSSEGIIFTTDDAILNYNESTCSFNNTSIIGRDSQGCEGVFADDSQVCLSLEMCNTFPPTEYPSVAPSDVPSFVSRDCYETLQGLQAAIVNAEERDDPATIRVCPDTTLDGNAEYKFSPLNISKGVIKLECGKRGTLSEGCMLFGGANAQIYIGPNVKSVSVSGFSMVDAGTISVLAAGRNSSVATFRNCQWRNNHAIAAVVVYNEASGEPYIGQRNLELLKSPTKRSMSVNIELCYFEENQFSYAAIATIRGRAHVESVLFRDNGTGRLGSIGATISSELYILSSCFIKNEALLHGVVMIDATSSITQETNFGEENKSIIGNCTTVFNDVSGTCAVDGNCQGRCIPFAAESCDRSILDVERQILRTPPPMLAPTMEPELPPPPTPANRTTNGTSPSDSSQAQSAPANLSSGAIFIIVVLVMIILCILWACCRKRKGKRDRASRGKGGQKGARAPLFEGKPSKVKFTKIKKEEEVYDEFDDYDNVRDDEYDDDFIDESESSFYKKEENPRRGWRSRGVGEKASTKKDYKKAKQRTRRIFKNKKGMKNVDIVDDDASSESSDKDPEVDEEVGVKIDATKIEKENGKTLQKSKSSLRQGSSVNETYESVISTSKGETVQPEMGSSMNSFDPFSGG